MALTASQQASRLFKKSFGAGETLTSRDFFEEPKLGREIIFSDQIWSESSLIPTTAPSLVSGASSGVVQYFEKQTLTHLAGSNNRAYFSANLIDAISFNFGDGTYNYSLYKNDGTTSIAFGDGDWLVDTAAGLLTFYGTLPSGVTSVLPPKISFYKYLGSKGVSTSSGTLQQLNAGLGLTGGGSSSTVTLDISLGNNSGLTFSNNNLSVDFDSLSSNLAGSGLSYSGGTLSVNVGNGLEIVSDTVYLGGTFSQDTTIDGDGFDLTIGNIGQLISTASYIKSETGGNYTVDLNSNYNRFVIQTTGISLLSEYLGTSSQINLTENFNEMISTDGGSSSAIKISNFPVYLSSDGSVNSMIVQDQILQKGLVYYDDYTGNFSTHSLITKGYVDSAISGFGAGTIAGVTAGNGLSGGGTANYITLDVNLGVNSGLTFSGDEIIIDNTIIPGNGLTANGYSLDVNVNSDSLEISNDLLRLKDTIDGDRIFQDSLTVNGSLIVNGTVSYIQTETLLIEDNIITLNATFSGSPFLNAGIEVIRGNQPTAALIWNESTDTWTAGLSGSEVDILLNAGLGLTKSGPTVSLDFNSIVGTGLTHNGNQISVDILGINGTPVYQYGTPSVTVGNNSTTGLAITSTPDQYSRIQVFINGQLQKLGDGTFSNVDCYFSNDGGLSALVLGSVSSGNALYWNGLTARFDLDNNDEVAIVYEN